MKHSRRDLLRYGACGLLGRAAFMTGFDRFSVISGMAATIAPADYKALVCIFLFGGNDANNTIVSIDNYTNYAAKRGSDLAIAQASLLPITPASGGNYGLHPSMTALQSLFSNAGKMSSKPPLAVIANVGTLIAPIKKSDYQAGVRPYQLFSHSDQQSEWQTSISNSDAPSGWAGRMADLMHDSATGFPTICSVAGVPIFTVGATTQPVAIAPAPTALNQTLRLVQSDSLIQTILTADQNPALPALVNASSNVTQFALNNSALLSSNPTITTAFPANNALGNQLLQVAKVIKLNSSLGLRRQIFFCSLGGFDTHHSQGAAVGTQSTLLQQLSEAMAAFYNATVELGVSNKVTTFTLSDFSRTFTPAGTGAAAGSDHAWGSHHFVMGDAVNGGDFYGAFPDLVVGGNQDVDSGPTARGRWIPSSSVDQYASTLALWYGLSSTDLTAVFPNIGRFTTNSLGFMLPG